jgi:hypothetical protein
VLQIVTSLVTVASEIRKELDQVQRIKGGITFITFIPTFLNPFAAEKTSASQKAGSLAKKVAALNDKIVTIEETLIGVLFTEYVVNCTHILHSLISSQCVCPQV